MPNERIIGAIGSLNIPILQDRLNLYLVARGIKPSSTITALADYNALEPAYNALRKIVRPAIYKIDGEVCLIDVAPSIGKLVRLMAASRSGDHGRRGRAYGFPKDSVAAYVEGTQKGDYFVAYWMMLANAISLGIPIPIELAYLSYVPNGCIIHDKLSDQSLRLGARYRQTVIQGYPGLAAEVENNFINSLSKLGHGNHQLKGLDPTMWSDSLRLMDALRDRPVHPVVGVAYTV